MTRLTDCLSQGDRASQPDAATTPEGALYFVTDEGVIEQVVAGSWESFGGTVMTTGSPANGNLAKFTAAGTISNADLTGAVTTAGGVATTLATGLSPDFAAILLGAQKFQCFVIRIVNTAGTLQHQIICQQGSSTASSYADKITGASSTLANTPTVGAGTDFTSGAGIVTNNIVLNTAAQVAATFFGIAFVDYYNGSSTLPYPIPRFISRDVNGTTRVRLEIGMIISSAVGSAWNIDTTRIPSGNEVDVRVLVALA